MQPLVDQIKNCTVCAPFFDHDPRPVISVAPNSKILLVGQAPGTKVHASGIPWDDQSGKRLRLWLDIDSPTFYDPANIAIVPMGFCYPGHGKSGDLPPRKECAPLWHTPLLEEMKEIKLTLLVGMYAQKYYLGKSVKKNLTETVRAYEEYLPHYLPLPHPSPRNGIWLRKHPWFEANVLPVLKLIVKDVLD